jgi:EmrB/QacA subfamily drug resistance transporter
MAQATTAPAAPPRHEVRPWPALFALCVGFFMILVDTTIVSVATPAIIEDLHAQVNSVVWVTSAYLLAYAVPVLITGRLGDRYGQRRLYLIGLTLFTLSSLWCGLTGSVEMLILARVFQGFGASMMTPQTMAVITRIFPAERRGQAMSLWGATAGVAVLVGPVVGGVLVDNLGWEWIFFINVPVGVIGWVLAWRLVPVLETHQHSFDWLGVALSGVGMFALVFGIQEGQQYDWGTITGPISVWGLIIVGAVVLAAFLWWQSRIRREPLVPLGLFSDRNFSLANVGITTMGFAVTAQGFPLMLYAQLVRGLSPTKASLLFFVPVAVMSFLLAPLVGKLSDRLHPRLLTAFGFAGTAGAMFWVSLLMSPDLPLWQVVPPMTLLGIGSAFVWAPLSATATRNLAGRNAGAGAGVYNATRQVGAVLGSAAIAVLMDSRLAAQGLHFDPSRAGSGALPARVLPSFSDAMAQAMYLPPAVLLVGLVAVVFFARPRHQAEARAAAAEPAAA